MHVIGIDWAASDEAKRGLALGRVAAGSIEIVELLMGRQAVEGRSALQLAKWLDQHPGSLVAIDAPLGWPSKLGRAVATHVAGEPLGTMEDAPTFFTRETDRFVKRCVGQNPLEVGADRIARMAFSALCLIAELRGTTGLPLPMAWEPDDRGVLEVYPAATLRAFAAGGKVPSYKKPEHTEARRTIAGSLASVVRMTEAQVELAVKSDHLLDAVACVVAGADFAASRAMAPPAEMREIARQEGWIWTRALAPLERTSRG